MDSHISKSRCGAPAGLLGYAGRSAAGVGPDEEGAQGKESEGNGEEDGVYSEQGGGAGGCGVGVGDEAEEHSPGEVAGDEDGCESEKGG